MEYIRRERRGETDKKGDLSGEMSSEMEIRDKREHIHEGEKKGTTIKQDEEGEEAARWSKQRI